MPFGLGRRRVGRLRHGDRLDRHLSPLDGDCSEHDCFGEGDTHCISDGSLGRAATAWESPSRRESHQRGTVPRPLCVCAGRDSPRAGTHRTGNQCGVISPGASHATTRGPRDGSGVHTPSVHRRPPCPWVLASCVGCRLGRCTLVGCRLGRSTLVECRLGRSTLVGCRLGRSTLV